MPLGLVLRVPVEFKEGTPCVARVKLHALKAVNILLPGNTHAELLRPSLAGLLRFRAVALADDHIAAIAVTAPEKTTGRGVVFCWCDDFKKVWADWKQ